ncbi:MAG: hypothetical protein MJ177_08090 [Clostridia bacterium]|nr:hypothetical protein [Clostridia bacterium]
MSKIFNRTTIKIFVPLLIVFFLAGTGMFIGRVYMSAEIEDLVTADKGGTDSELTNKIVSFLGDALKNYAKNNDIDLGDSESKEEEEIQYSAKTLAAMSKQKTLTVLGIVFYALTLVFIGFSITSAAYSSYLDSDKYRAKLRRLETAEKRKASMK